ncbi:TfuA-like protein [Herbaspirillum sp. SJZ107]|uniref:TfuA-like protein n=1 Tax=Herbaspirillum sp. SJZ107 TaxID=2572881 RepID=UPI00114EFA2B|nr:TfuA-like protein [Herbaspirillum sp. SJZ107]TQK03374.1 hypothetical protein FBX97_4940 [Herbaspirillum sp. SJZ107]
MNAPVVAFIGPSLPLAEARAAFPDIAFRPPVRFGDVARALQECFGTIVIVDGVFEQVPAIWHKEILLALARGVRVIGAASMGALRAAELDGFGMEGIGWVYEQYRDGLEQDDEVALVHGDADSGYVNLSMPLVQLRYAAHAATPGDPAAALLERLADALQPVFYRERTAVRIEALAYALADDPAQAHSALAHLNAPRSQVKRLDALAALAAAARPAPAPAPAAPLEHTAFLQRLQKASLAPEDTQDPRALLAHALAACAGDAARQPSPAARGLLRAWQKNKQLLSKAAVGAWLMRRQLDEPTLFSFIDACDQLAQSPARAGPDQQHRAGQFLKFL